MNRQNFFVLTDEDLPQQRSLAIIKPEEWSEERMQQILKKTEGKQ